jgi:chromosome segregation ATPase
MNIIKKLFAVTTVLLLLITVISYGQKPKTTEPDVTIEKNKADNKFFNFDIAKALNELTTALNKVKIEINNTDWKKIENEIKSTINDLNLDKAFNEINKSLAEIDTKKLAEQLSKEKNNINLDEFKIEMNKAFEQIKNIDFNKLKAELGNIKIEIDPKQKDNLQNNMEKLKPELQKKMEELKMEMEKLKKEVKKTKNQNFTNSKNIEYENTRFLTPLI